MVVSSSVGDRGSVRLEHHKKRLFNTHLYGAMLLANTMPNLLDVGGVIATIIFFRALAPAVSAAECDFFKVEGGYLASVGDFGGDLGCSPYPSVEAAKEKCRSMVGCDGFSFGPWGTGLGGCLKMNRKGGFTPNPEYVGYHKTLMGCCGDDRLQKAQCHVREAKHLEKPVSSGKRTEKLVSRGKPTTQSSVYHNAKLGPQGAVSSWAVDGNKNLDLFGGKSCSSTQQTLNPWWSVDLLDTFDLSRVQISGRSDCCEWHFSNLVISVGDNPFSVWNPACVIGGVVGLGKTKSFPCELRGRFVTITNVIPKEHLTLCEVEVFAMVTTMRRMQEKINSVA